MIGFVFRCIGIDSLLSFSMIAMMNGVNPLIAFMGFIWFLYGLARIID